MPLENIHPSELLNKFSDKEKDVAFELEELAKAGFEPENERKILIRIKELKKEGISTDRMSALIKDLVSADFESRLGFLAEIVSLKSVCNEDLLECLKIGGYSQSEKDKIMGYIKILD